MHVSLQQINPHKLSAEHERSRAGRGRSAERVKNNITSTAARPDTDVRQGQWHDCGMCPTEFFNRYVPHVAFVLAVRIHQSAKFCPAHPMLSAQVPLFLFEQSGLGPSVDACRLRL